MFQIFFCWWFKGIVFFFSREKFNATHSLIFGDFRFFFSRFWKKKKYNCIFFFPRKSLKATHSAERQLPLRNRYFCTFAVFFFSNKNVYFFFPGKVYNPLTHSISGAGKKKQGRKKKNTFLTHSLDFFPKVSIFKLFLGKKNTIPLVWTPFLLYRGHYKKSSSSRLKIGHHVAYR